MHTIEAAPRTAPENTLPMERLWCNETAQEVGHNLQQLLPDGELHDEFRKVVVKTPLVDATEYFDEFEAVPGYEVQLKNEIGQPSRSYKVRGARGKLSLERQAAHAAGKPLPNTVVLASTGNCAAAGGAAASDYEDMRVIVKCPTNLSPAKEENIIANGVAPQDIHNHYNSFPEALVAAEIEGKEPGKLFMAPYDCTRFMAGNATAAVEVKDQLDARAANGELDYHNDIVTYFFPGGGGGYAAANIVSTILTNPNARVVIVQAEGCAGMLGDVDPAQADTSVDGAAVPIPGQKPMAIINDRRLPLSIEIMTVSKAEVGEAMLHAQNILSTSENVQRAEPAGALALAGALKMARANPRNTDDTRRHVMVPFMSGGNVTREKFHEFMVAAGVEPHEWARSWEEQSWAYANRPAYGVVEALARKHRTTQQYGLGQLAVASGPTHHLKQAPADPNGVYLRG